MISLKRKADPTLAEFIVIVSAMMSLTALSIDAMLPALAQISSDLNVQNANDRQLIVSLIVLGMAVGQLFFGPLSDKTGRKPAMYGGYAVFIAGALLSMLAVSFPMLLFGRLLQGVGISAPRAVTLALVRDRYEGRGMARVMSFVMTIFILIPMIAPTLGQTLLIYLGWRSIFGSFIVLALITLLWFGLRMPETLAPQNRAPFSAARISGAVREIIKIRPAVGFTVTAGFIAGAHLGYLNSAQQIFQEQYELGEQFPLYFAVVAFSIGLASFLNARLVMRFGMSYLVWRALFGILVLSMAAFGVAWVTAGQPPLWLLIAYLMLVFFCIGILFGNMNALAMRPLGHIAGIGAAVVGSLSTLISVPLGIAIGRSYNDTVLPIIAGMAILTATSMVVIRWAEDGTSETDLSE